ncbi:Palmitoyltransferase [Clarireedia jacksonii]
MAHLSTLSRYRITSIQDLAQPFCYLYMSFLAYASQILFHYIEPGPLSGKEAILFNVSVWSTLICYYRTCHVDPGRKGWVNGFVGNEADAKVNDRGESTQDNDLGGRNVRWCKKCENVKPPRAHHCKQCKRCIPKMDHHCPWTNNCVSHTTFPHFIRFLFYSVLSLTILTSFLYTRISNIFSDRDLPAYLGPSKTSLAFLLIITCSNGLTLFAMTILFLRTCYSLSINTTMIESWEIERHTAIIERSRRMGGYVYANGGSRVRVKKVEFPYDVGIWPNIVQGMGTGNPVAWIWPFSRGPSLEETVAWEENGFNDKEGEWPPIDPDKLGRRIDRAEIVPGCTPQNVYESVEDERDAFKRRQETDLRRWQNVTSNENIYADDGNVEEIGYGNEYEEGLDGEEGWTNSEGDRLKDFGVDEDADTLDEDDIPLGELLRRRKARGHAE